MVMTPTKFVAVVAVTKEWGIGNNGNLPWHPRRLHIDTAFLKYATTHRYSLQADGEIQFDDCQSKNVVIMGRKTWNSIPPRFRPMDGRINIVITSNTNEFDIRNADARAKGEVYAVNSFELAIDKAANSLANGGQIFVLGGSGIYEVALNDSRCEAVLITRLQSHPELPCDVFFPDQLLADFPKRINITKYCLEFLVQMISKNARFQLDESSKLISEEDISYSIEVWYK